MTLSPKASPLRVSMALRLQSTCKWFRDVTSSNGISIVANRNTRARGNKTIDPTHFNRRVVLSSMIEITNWRISQHDATRRCVRPFSSRREINSPLSGRISRNTSRWYSGKRSLLIIGCFHRDKRTARRMVGGDSRDELSFRRWFYARRDYAINLTKIFTTRSTNRHEKYQYLLYTPTARLFILECVKYVT